MPRDVVLIGYRASGKSCVGRAAAARLGWGFVELDDVALAISGRASVAAVFEDDGEPVWRAAEAAAMAAVLAVGDPERPRVIATGGGAVMVESVSQAIRAAQEKGQVRVVYLEAEADVLRRRLEADSGGRPRLSGKSVVDEVETILEQRRGRYEELADVVVDAAGSLKAVVDSVVEPG